MALWPTSSSSTQTHSPVPCLSLWAVPALSMHKRLCVKRAQRGILTVTWGFLKRAYFSMRSMNISLLWLSRVQFKRFSTKFSWSSKIRSESGRREKREEWNEDGRYAVFWHANVHLISSLWGPEILQSWKLARGCKQWQFLEQHTLEPPIHANSLGP